MQREKLLNISLASPDLSLANIDKNLEAHKAIIEKAYKDKSQLLVFPELSLTGSTVADLFLNESFLDQAKAALKELIKFSEDKEGLVIVVGLPFKTKTGVYDLAATFSAGKLLALSPKTTLSNQDSKNESRYFTSFNYEEAKTKDSIFTNIIDLEYKDSFEKVRLGIVVGEDIDSHLVQDLKAQGVEVLVHPQALPSIVNNTVSPRDKSLALSKHLNLAILEANSNTGESSKSNVYEARLDLFALGKTIASKAAASFRDSLYLNSFINLSPIRKARRSLSTESVFNEVKSYKVLETKPLDLGIRKFYKYPFLEQDDIYELDKLSSLELETAIAKAKKTLNLQALGLARRAKQINTKKLILGVSGGLDSTLALLVALRASKLLGKEEDFVLALSLPGFGSSKQTKDNTKELLAEFNLDSQTISIDKAVLQHFKDIEHDPTVHDLTYENSQARERTQILMDLSNKYNGMVVGTGDLSENALGWCTYNGDQMSMYAVNASIPKTTMRFMLLLLAYDLRRNERASLAQVLEDIVKTPVSPELKPVDEEGNIQQETESEIGPYILHDFFLYHYVYRGNSIANTFAFAVQTFKELSKEKIHEVFGIFLKRLYTQAFKRKAFPDAVKVTPSALSNDGDFRIPSDMDIALIMEQWRKLLD